MHFNIYITFLGSATAKSPSQRWSHPDAFENWWTRWLNNTTSNKSSRGFGYSSACGVRAQNRSTVAVMGADISIYWAMWKAIDHNSTEEELPWITRGHWALTTSSQEDGWSLESRFNKLHPGHHEVKSAARTFLSKAVESREGCFQPEVMNCHQKWSDAEKQLSGPPFNYPPSALIQNVNGKKWEKRFLDNIWVWSVFVRTLRPSQLTGGGWECCFPSPWEENSSFKTKKREKKRRSRNHTDDDGDDDGGEIHLCVVRALYTHTHTHTHTQTHTDRQEGSIGTNWISIKHRHRVRRGRAVVSEHRRKHFDTFHLKNARPRVGGLSFVSPSVSSPRLSPSPPSLYTSKQQ